MPTALHEILAVENTAAETANRIQTGTTKTLEQKRTLFSGLTKEHQIFDDNRQDMKQATEYKEVESTVQEQLDYVGDELIRYWDITLQKEEANQRAVANITIDDVVIAENVPVTVLLGMEKKLSSLLSMYNAIPTLDASKIWEPDSTYAKPGVFRTKHHRETQQSVTYKTYEEISPATKEHKAQIAQVEKTETIGKYLIDEFSGSTTSLDKAEKLQRLVKLIAAVKTARQRANSTAVNTKLLFGKDLIDFING